MVPEGVATALLAVCAALALAVARRSPEHRPLAAALCGLLGASLILIGLHHVLVGPVPFTGWLRAGMRLEIALRVLWRWAVAAALWWTLGSRRGAWACLGVGAAIALGCAAAYPWLRQERLFTAYAWIHFAASSASLLAVLAQLVSPRRIPKGAEVPALILASGSAAQTFGAWFAGTPVQDWYLARLGSVIIYAVLSLVLLWQAPRHATGGPSDA
jgi:hypothetical protein